jgi:hypothetical protein
LRLRVAIRVVHFCHFFSAQVHPRSVRSRQKVAWMWRSPRVSPMPAHLVVDADPPARYYGAAQLPSRADRRAQRQSGLKKWPIFPHRTGTM